MITVNCSCCGKAVPTHPSRASRTKFCSRWCLARSKTGENARNFKDGRTILHRTCRQCGREFIGAARNHYCSRECFAASRPPTFLTCLQCGRRFGPVDHLTTTTTRYRCVGSVCLVTVDGTGVHVAQVGRGGPWALEGMDGVFGGLDGDVDLSHGRSPWVVRWTYSSVHLHMSHVLGKPSSGIRPGGQRFPGILFRQGVARDERKQR